LGLIAQQVLCLADVGLGVTHVTGAEVTVTWGGLVVDVAVFQGGFQGIEQGVECGSVTQGHVVHLVLGIGFCGGGQDVDLHHVFNKAEVTAGFAITVDEDFIALDHGGGPFGDDRGVGAIGILTFAEHVEVAQADGVEIVGAGKHVGVEFVDVFGDGIRGQRLADAVFDLGQARVIAVGGAGSGVGEALYPFILGCHQHVQEPVDVGLIGGDGVVDGTRDRAQRRLVEDVVCTGDGFFAVFQVADVAFDKGEVGPLVGADFALYFVQVVLVAGGEVVQADDGLVQLQEGFQQVGADEACYAGDEPGFGAGFELLLYLFVAGCHGGSVCLFKQASSCELLAASLKLQAAWKGKSRPFGPRLRRFAPQVVLLHSLPESPSEHGFCIFTCPLGLRLRRFAQRVELLHGLCCLPFVGAVVPPRCVAVAALSRSNDGSYGEASPAGRLLRRCSLLERSSYRFLSLPHSS